MSSVVLSTFTLLGNHRHRPSTELFSSSAAQYPCVSGEIPLLSSQWGSQKPHSHLPWDWDAGLWPGSTRQMHPCGPCCRWEPRKKQAWVRLPCLLVWMEHRCPAFGGGGCHDGASQRWQSQAPDAEVKTVLAVVVTAAGLVPEAYRACHGW